MKPSTILPSTVDRTTRNGRVRFWPRRQSTIAAGALVLLLAPTAGARAQAVRGDAWDVTQPRGEVRTVEFATSEGTWMSVDPAPGGGWVAFDLLGDIYRVPMSGGAAQNLTAGPGVATNLHPRYSPDGATIAFISDRAGQYNLWLMDADGARPRPVVLDPEHRMFDPTWTPDGQHIVVRRCGVCLPHRGGPNGLWMFSRTGGQGVELLGGESGRPMVNRVAWPSVSPDRRHVYFHAYAGEPDDVTLIDVVRGAWQLRRLDLETGEVVPVTEGVQQYSAQSSSGSAYAPEVSPDGRWLAFARRIPDGTISYKGHRFGPRTALWLRDLRSGRERVVMDPITTDVAEGVKMFRILPGYGWTSDSRAIVISEGGRLRRLDVESGEVVDIPFTAPVRRTFSQMARGRMSIDDEPFEVRFPRWHTASPDGRTLAFQAVGRIWLMDLPDGTPRRLTTDVFDHLEYAPSWSPDGQNLAFTTFDDVDGHVWRVPSRGGRPIRLTREPAEYLNPTWSPDGSTLVVARGTGASARGRGAGDNPYWDLIRLPATGGPDEPVTTVVARGGRSRIVRPVFGPEGRIYFSTGASQEGRDGLGLVSVAMDGSDRRVHLIVPRASEITMAPDGRHIAFEEGFNVYLAPWPSPGAAGAAALAPIVGDDLPIRRLSREGGLFAGWVDGGTLGFGSGRRFYLTHVESGVTDTAQIRLTAARAIPRGSVALTGARIVTLARRSEVVERGTVIVEGSRLVCVGECDPSGADRIVDVSRATIIPGWIDMHAHHHGADGGLIPRRDWEAAVYLAYGVTTTLDPSTASESVFPMAELIRSGQVVGPRVYSSGEPLSWGGAGTRGHVDSPDEARWNVNRLVDWGAASIKQYLLMGRDQRQWVADAARASGVNLTSEGASLVYNIGMILDGHTGWEHPLSYVPLYQDVTRFFGQAGATYSTTAIVAGPGPWNQGWFFQSSDWWRDEKQRRFLPWQAFVPHLRRRMERPETDYSYPLLAQGLADVLAAGGRGAIGGHGQAHGIGTHWEVWMYASALGNLEALRLASLDGARFLGAEADLGSLEVGKLADLVVLDSNPLEDIHNTLDIRYVMRGGVLYDGSTLDEVWPQAKPYGDYWWVNPAALRTDDRPAGRGGS